MMELRKLAAALLVFALVTSAAARAEDRSKDDTIRELLEMTGTVAVAEQAGQQMMSLILEQNWKLLRKLYPQAPDHMRTLIEEELKIAFREALPEFVDAVIVIYSRYFTIAEVNDMVAFYKTETGRKVIRVLPELMAESMAMGAKWGEHIVGPLAAERVRDKLRHEGYEL